MKVSNAWMEVFRQSADKYRVSKPFFLAAVFGTKETLDIFLEFGVDIFQQNKHSNNVIQCLVMVAHLSPELDEHTQILAPLRYLIINWSLSSAM